MNSIGPKNASRIWGFMSKFVMLDRFAKTLGGAEAHPGISVPKTKMQKDQLGSAAKVSTFFKKNYRIFLIVFVAS